MPTIQLHYDGWLTLPAEARRHLDVATGDRLDIELTKAGLLLRSAKQAKQIAAREPEMAVAQPAAAPAEPSEPVEAETAVAKRGRPRKAVTPDLTPPSVKVGGRRKSLPADTA
ncbi:MAG TPA: AbrB/MazE/SpoVT family DNA-binding domain-containing protein [Geminicoccus sp.]|uniref:AbrB/MazE/SpoVT family DNA-binding domain-containing protein n=1 Tax=Geminicoccus sp. TaxID=2024832 RepID=UPI002E325B89|nr:AbrB/MazE/SpoVT family DNA-binding domain-containing protein [Geminicoccus sp.]HEX2526166.1 AbrB/MazE/SpoVT family DNA-binding domain-containing protein [Geminicoccus sp.]